MLRVVESIIVLFLSVVLMALGLETRSDLFVFSPSPSVGHRLFVRAFRPPWAGDFVVFCAPEQASRLLRARGYPSHPRCPDERVRLVKLIAATRRGEVFVLGSHPHSVDSRTFGWIPFSELLTVVPLDRAGAESQP